MHKNIYISLRIHIIYVFVYTFFFFIFFLRNCLCFQKILGKVLCSRQMKFLSDWFSSVLFNLMSLLMTGEKYDTWYDSRYK